MKYIVGTDEEPLATACKMYWETDEEGFFTYRIAEIVKETGLSQPKINKAATQYTAAFSEETSCMDCGQPYEYKNRPDYQNLDEGRDWRCEKCLQEIAFDEVKHKQYELMNRYKRLSEEGFAPQEMAFDTMAKLMALLKHSASEDMTTIQPVGKNKEDLFSPNVEYTGTIISELLNDDVITYDPESNMDSMTMTPSAITPSTSTGLYLWGLITPRWASFISVLRSNCPNCSELRGVKIWSKNSVCKRALLT